MYDNSMDSIHERLFKRSPTRNLLYTSEFQNVQWPGYGVEPDVCVIIQFSINSNHVSPVRALAYMLPRVDANQLFYSDSWRVVHKQDHLVCFLGGSLMLGATEARAPVPPKPRDLSRSAIRDWNSGQDLIDTCMATHETAT